MTKKADGSVIIDTKIDTSAIDNLGGDIAAQFKDIAAQSEDLTRKINQSFDAVTAEPMADNVESSINKIDASGLADEIGDAAREGFREAEAAASSGADDIQREVNKINADKAGRNISESISDGYEKAARSSKVYSDQIQDDLDDISREAKEAADDVGKVGQAGAQGGGSGAFMSGIVQGVTGGTAAMSAAFSSVASTLAGLGIGYTIKEVTEAVIEFGVHSVQVASDLEEVQNVVDVTFGSMSDKVNEFAKNAAKTAGLSEKQAKQYIGTYGAMAKAIGFTEEQALEMSIAMTQMVGDVSSFYNLDHDEAFRKLTSAFTGETETLKELGVVMTQTNKDNYALANGFEKTTSEMTAQEQVVLQFSYMMDGLSAATGDFVRTQDGWANQTRTLSLQWENFSATIGGMMITILTPFVEFLNKAVMPALQWLADALAKVIEFFYGLGEAIADTIKGEEELVDSNTETADTVVDNMAGVMGAYEDTADAAAESVSIQIGLFDELETKTETTLSDILSNWQEKTEAFAEYAENLQKAIDAGLNKGLVESLSDGTEQSIQLIGVFAQNLDQASVNMINSTYERLQEAEAMTEKTMSAAGETAGEVFSEPIVEKAEEATKSVKEELRELQEYVNSMQSRAVIDVVLQYSTTGVIPTNLPLNLPMLASGAVIPPNAPFAAILGDQRSGVNIEAPAEEIYNQVRRAMDDNGGRTGEVESLLRTLIDVVAGIEIGDDTIGRAAARYNHRASRAGGY